MSRVNRYEYKDWKNFGSRTKTSREQVGMTKEKFAEKINHRGITSCEYVYLPGTRHETYCSDDRTMQVYLDKIMKFLDSCSGEMFSHYEVLRE